MVSKILVMVYTCQSITVRVGVWMGLSLETTPILALELDLTYGDEISFHIEAGPRFYVPGSYAGIGSAY